MIFETEKFELAVLSACENYYFALNKKHKTIDSVAEYNAWLNISYINYLVRAGDFIKNYIYKLNIPHEEKKSLTRVISGYQMLVGVRISPYTKVVINAESLRIQKEDEARRRRWEFDRLYEEYKWEKSRAIQNDLRNIGLGLGGLAVTILSGGTATILYIGVVASSLAIVGGSIKLYLDSNGKEEISNWIPTDYSDVIGITLLYTIGDTEEVRRTNAILDVVEGILFFRKDITSFNASANILIQGFEVYEEFKDRK